MKKTISICLLCAMLLSAVACAEKQEETISDQTSEQLSTAEPEEELDSLEARKKVSDNLPAFDGEGRPFTILVQHEWSDDAGVEAITGDPLNDAIYERNLNVGNRFNVAIGYEDGGNHSDMSAKVRKTVQSDDDAYDLCLAHIIQTGSDVTNNLYMNLNEVNYIDPSRPWYPQFSVQASELNGKRYALVSDIAISSCHQTYCIYFNKKIGADYGISDTEIYDKVKSGAWTIDALDEYTRGIYSDLNGNGKRDDKDLFGNKTLLYYSFNFLWAFDQPILSVEDDTFELVINCEKTVNILDKLYSFYYENDGTRRIGYEESKKAFAQGESFFLMCHFIPALRELREMEMPYGLVPFPKWDETQESYKTTIDGGFDVMVIPVTVRDTDFSGLMAEALSAESWKSVLPKFYDISLKVKGIRDEESIAMVDEILNNRVIDFSYMYTGWDGFNFIISDMLNAKKGGDKFASTYKSLEKKATKVYQKKFDFFFNS